MLGEMLVTFRVTLTSSPDTERVGRIFLSTEIGLMFSSGSARGMKRRIAIGRTKTVSQGVLSKRLRKMNAYATVRYPRAFLVSEVSRPLVLELCG